MDTQPTCTWVLHLPGASLRCAVHDALTAPWNPAADCALPVAVMCAVCLRTPVPIRSRFSWSFLCHRCAAIDDGLAEPFDARGMTPHEGQTMTESGTMFGLLFPDRVHQLTLEDMVMGPPGISRVVTREDPPATGHQPIAVLLAHREATASAMVVASFTDGGPTPTQVPSDAWAERFPASAAASSRAYQDYVARVHPWIDSVEPRVADVDWLRSLVGGG